MALVHNGASDGGTIGAERSGAPSCPKEKSGVFLEKKIIFYSFSRALEGVKLYAIILPESANSFQTRITSQVILKINWALSVQRKGLELNDKERQSTEGQQILCIVEASP
ncbi:hypothetical protein MJG53_009669 [Ovis ammon polii x Ovis aries]|uniref:Uncharacterized protein n=1 Tax=Ovis ammon polii x Ovis aries TaxID=2918886 RepID=A0ACB9UXQ8_9CETA|nr:hypothetical protein MJG53_009669 [Ovis ammon polii x Ovis aries]